MKQIIDLYEEDLLACPFCGKAAGIKEFEEYGCFATYVYYDVGCDTNDCFAERCQSNYYFSPQEARAAWNKRSASE